MSLLATKGQVLWKLKSIVLPGKTEAGISAISNSVVNLNGKQTMFHSGLFLVT